jgi:hypothetical protein
MVEVVYKKVWCDTEQHRDDGSDPQVAVGRVFFTLDGMRYSKDFCGGCMDMYRTLKRSLTEYATLIGPVGEDEEPPPSYKLGPLVLGTEEPNPLLGLEGIDFTVTPKDASPATKALYASVREEIYEWAEQWNDDHPSDQVKISDHKAGKLPFATSLRWLHEHFIPTRVEAPAKRQRAEIGRRKTDKADSAADKPPRKKPGPKAKPGAKPNSVKPTFSAQS